MFTNSNTKLLLVLLLAMVLICMLNTGKENLENDNVEVEALNEDVVEETNEVTDEQTINTNSDELVKPNDLSEDNNKAVIDNEEMINSVLEPMTNVEPSDMSKTEGADINSAGTSVTAQNMEKLMKENDKNKLKFDAGTLLPKEVNDEWFETDFGHAQVNVDDSNLIVTDRYITGVNTVGQSLKNPSWDLRAAPACPKMTVSPWLQSTIEPDFNLKPIV
tara:strand:+ start:18 stop:674 length:657 start_codon:yes stop_codon:yes gene_type:complete